MIKDNCSGWAEKFMVMMKLRKQIVTFRDIIDLPPCDDSGPIHELALGYVRGEDSGWGIYRWKARNGRCTSRDDKEVVPLVDTELSSTKPRRKRSPDAPPHEPFEDWRVRSVSAKCPGRSYARCHAHGGGPTPRTRREGVGTHAPHARREWGSRAHTRGPRTRGCSTHAPRARGNSRTREAPRTRHALVSEGSRERGRGQGRGHHRGIGKGRWTSQARGRTVRCFYCDQEGHIKRDCPKYKAQDQSSDTAATAVMADEDESDVLLAASDNGKSDWVLDSGSAYHLCRDREVFSTYAACEGRIWMANNTSSRVVGRGSVWFRMADGRSVTLTEVRHVPNLRKNLISIGMLDAKGCSFKASGGIFRVSKGNKEMLWGKKTRGLYRLEGSVQIGGATVQHGSSGISKENGQGKQPLHRGTQSKRRGTWRIRSGTRAQGDALGYVRKSGQTRVVQPVQDVHRKAQRKETKSIFEKLYNEGRGDAEARHLGEKVQALRCGGAYTSVGSGVAR
ncbi:hydroxyproline-rich glycoprotein family protein [Actinidia rufa]|uniref:Hydroxyproline-rich glycoprotein family protein n=1 Tax=Actinidia rufa TaxID=165716 RepID=A0A7J0GQ42_9ERIC|nr:hydroxyproline-rich glycoprotein family protein [Actinidia rufa]